MTPDQLRQAVEQLPHPAGNDHWTKNRRWLRKHILGEQIDDDPIDNLLQWPEITSTMYVGKVNWLDAECSDLTDRLKQAAIHSSVGKPPCYDGNYDSNLIHQAYHLMQWEEATGQAISNLSYVVEFGGGYGAMGLVVSRLGFKGDYVIVDLPEYLLLQEYYLSNTSNNGDRIKYGLDFAGDCDLLIALFSISEVSIGRRTEFLDGIEAKNYLIAYMPFYDGIDNTAWFRGWIDGKPEYNWQEWTMEHYPGARYIVGRLK